MSKDTYVRWKTFKTFALYSLLIIHWLLKLSCFQDKEIYRWPIKESIKAMLAWEWTVEKARDGEGEAEKKAVGTRKISQTAQVQEKAFWSHLAVMSLVFLSPKLLKSTRVSLNCSVVRPLMIPAMATAHNQ